MKPQSCQAHIEILPAALLSKRPTWQTKARSLPTGACLLITNSKNKEQIQLMHTLTRSFRQQGKQVFLWTINKGRND